MKKGRIIMALMLVFTLAGCGRTTDNTPSSGTTQNNESTVQESESGEQTEALESRGDETGEDASVPVTAGSVVYMTTDISPEGLMAVYEALGWVPSGSVAVKISTGEPPASNYLRPELIADLVQSVDGTIVECNTAYGGSRAETAMHYQVAKDHGFTDIADVKILDEDGSMLLPVEGGSVLSENYVGLAFADYDSYIILSHFKGHAMAGFGGAIKNISIGLGSSKGKCWIHSGGTSTTNPWGGKQDAFLESMAEAGKSVSDYLGNGEHIVYINVMNRLSVDCDCDGNPSEPDMHDIYEQKDGDGASLVNRMESRNGLHTLEHAEEIGLGSRTYELINIKEEEQQEEAEMKMKVQVGDTLFTATLAENSSVDALKELMADGPLTLKMSDYANMEKGADLGVTLPQNNEQMNTLAGDIILYQGRTFVIYYDTNSWSLTPIGKIDNVDAEELREALGTGDVTVTLSIE